MTQVRARVIGLGQSAAGDDGVGAAVVRALRARGLPDDVEALEATDTSALVTLVEPGVLAVVVDAVLGTPAGEVVNLAVDALAPRTSRGVSSHGLGVAEALGLAQVMNGADPREVRIVAITIRRPTRQRTGLSPDVAAAVPSAVEHVLWMLGTAVG